MKTIKSQKKKYGPKFYAETGKKYRIVATVQHDDQCGNGHNSFSITGEIDRKAGNGRWMKDSCGCIHEEIKKHFPELAPLIKWHLTSTDGPMHYIANTAYWLEEKDPDNARSSAIWPDATMDDLTDPDLEGRLKKRLPALMADFRAAVESLGFTF